jgi:hypothetical protein
VAERWSPPLQVRANGLGCRLSLGGLSYGDGDTLQDAADDLVRRLLNLAMCTRSSGMTFSPEMAPEPRWLDFLWELGEIAGRGGDIRHRLFGSPGRSGALD